jgi:peroxiredoxin Q/BCP
MKLTSAEGRPLLEAGDLAPNFTLSDQTGASVELSSLLATGPVVLFFYPAAMTIGCTREACHFRDAGPEFAALGAARIGISADPQSTQSEFSRQNRLDFPLLTDADGTVAKAYGARRTGLADSHKRATFVIGTDGIVLAVVSSQLRMREHADRSLAVLRSTRPLAG